MDRVLLIKWWRRIFGCPNNLASKILKEKHVLDGGHGSASTKVIQLIRILGRDWRQYQFLEGQVGQRVPLKNVFPTFQNYITCQSIWMHRLKIPTNGVEVSRIGLNTRITDKNQSEQAKNRTKQK